MSIPAQGAVGAANTDAIAWLAKRLKAARSDSEAHPEGHPNRTFYRAQAIAYENVLSLLEKENRIAAALASPRADSDERTAGEGRDQIADRMQRAFPDLSRLDAECAAEAAFPECLSTPAQPAGAVPDSLRALSEAATKGEWYTESEKCDGAYGSGEDCSEGYLAYSILTDAEPRYGNPGVIAETSNSTLGVIHEEADEDGFTAWDETARANTAFIVAAVNFVRTLLASHPAGQSAGSGAEGSSPRPWTFGPSDNEVAAQIYDATGVSVCEFWSDKPNRDADAALIVAAVNAARPAAPEAQGAWKGIETAVKKSRPSIIVETEITAHGRTDKVEFIAHWAEDLSGEEQPPFRGWFYATGYGFAQLPGTPKRWRPLPAPPASSGQGGR